MSNSDTWIENFADKAPAFTLLRAGYDVWLGNNRGNSHSLQHTTKKPTDPDFYFYSFQELGDYDLPTQIDKVLELTGKSSLSYIGHSQGTSQMFYALAKNEAAFKDKINLFVALAPITRLDHTTNSMLQNWGNNGTEDMKKVMKETGIHINAMFTPIFQTMMTSTCKAIPTMCQAARELIFGKEDGVNHPLSSTHHCSRVPDTASFQQLDHFSKVFAAKDFVDYSGAHLDLTQIKNVPVMVVQGSKDDLSTPTDGKWAYDQLGKGVSYQVIDGFNHGSFSNAKDMSYFSGVLDQIKAHNPLP